MAWLSPVRRALTVWWRRPLAVFSVKTRITVASESSEVDGLGWIALNDPTAGLIVPHGITRSIAVPLAHGVSRPLAEPSVKGYVRHIQG